MQKYMTYDGILDKWVVQKCLGRGRQCSRHVSLAVPLGLLGN